MAVRSAPSVPFLHVRPGGTLVLHAVGRRTGNPHPVIVAYALDGPDVVTVAMNGWGEGRPAWWLNLQAHPETTVDLPDGPRQVRGRAATGDERERLWRTWVRFDPKFDAYASHRRTETVVVVLEPVLIRSTLVGSVASSGGDRDIGTVWAYVSDSGRYTARVPSSTALFRTDVQHDVLRELVLSADGTRTAADLARSTGHPASSVAREVARLVDAGLVRTTTQGRRRLLDVDFTDPFMRAVRDAFTAAATIELERDRDVRWWLTMPEAAERIGEALRADDTTWANRLLCDAVNQIPLVAAIGGLDTMLAAPSSTGDERWDALLAGAVRYRLRLLDRPAPAWTAREPLPSWWWPAGRGARAVLAMQSTPPELSRLGIWFDARNLTTA